MKEKKFQRIVERAVKGDKAAFELLMQQKSKNILYIAMSIMRDRVKGEEVAQEAALSMQKNILQLKSPERFDSWMYRIVYNECMDEKKHESRTRDHGEINAEVEETMPEERNELLPEEFVYNKEKREDLLAFVNKLPDRYRACILLFYYGDLSYQEVADAMNISIYDVANYLRCAKQKLRQQLIGCESDKPTEGMSEPKDSSVVHLEKTVRSEEKTTPAEKVGMLSMSTAITQVFHFDETEVITASMTERLLATVSAGAVVAKTGAAVSAPVATAAATATATAAVAGSQSLDVAQKGAVFSSTVVKTSIALLCSAALLAGVVLYVPNMSREENPANYSVPTQEDFTQKIELDDSQAEQFIEFSEEEKPKEEWDDFVKKANLYYMGKALERTNQTEYEYRMYLLSNAQDNTYLITIERSDNNNKVQIVYRLVDSIEAVPAERGLIDAFYAWQ